jgi:hypothetical protein
LLKISGHSLNERFDVMRVELCLEVPDGMEDHVRAKLVDGQVGACVGCDTPRASQRSIEISRDLFVIAEHERPPAVTGPRGRGPGAPSRRG